MSRRDKRYVWRTVTCHGCDRACRYRDYRAPGQPTFAEIRQSLYVATADRAKWRNKRRGTVLGILHAYKKLNWEIETRQCRELQSRYGDEGGAAATAAAAVGAAVSRR